MLRAKLQSSGSVLAFIAVIMSAAIPTGAAGSDAQKPEIAARNDTIVVGRITANPRKRLPSVRPMAEFLSTELRNVGITKSKVIFAETASEMCNLMREGKVDVISETAFSAIQLVDDGHAEMLLREWKKGVASYRSVLFATADSGITAFSDLVGKKLAFEDEDSTSAFLVPLAMLKRAGLQPFRLKSIRESVPPGKVGYTFAGSERNLVSWVSIGLADAGALSNLDWDDHERTPAVMKSNLSVFDESAPIIRSALLVRSGLAPEVKRALKRVLLDASSNPNAADALKAYFQVKKYDEITPTIASEISEMRGLVDLLKDAGHL